MKFPRRSGILLHPTSLPGPYGIGDLGDEAYRFVDLLAAAGQSYWQVLPLSPTGYGDSPYQGLSAFAGNPLLISPAKLVEAGHLSAADLAGVPDLPQDRVDFGAVIPYKMELLDRAFATFRAEAPRGERQRHRADTQRHRPEDVRADHVSAIRAGLAVRLHQTGRDEQPRRVRPPGERRERGQPGQQRRGIGRAAAQRDRALERDHDAEEAADHQRAVQRRLAGGGVRDRDAEAGQPGEHADDEAERAECEQRNAPAHGDDRGGRAGHDQPKWSFATPVIIDGFQIGSQTSRTSTGVPGGATCAMASRVCATSRSATGQAGVVIVMSGATYARFTFVSWLGERVTEDAYRQKVLQTFLQHDRLIRKPL